MAILKDVIQDDPDSSTVQGRIADLMKDHGGAEKAQELMTSSAKEIIQLNNNAVGKAKAGEYATASKMLAEAAARLPNNMQIVSNAAFSLLVDVFMNGMDAAKVREALTLQQAVLKKDGHHPKLVDIANILAKIKQKYSLTDNP